MSIKGKEADLNRLRHCVGNRHERFARIRTDDEIGIG